MQLLIDKKYNHQELYNYLKNYFKDFVFNEELWWILENVFSKSKIQIITSDYIIVNQKNLDRLSDIKLDLLNHKPLQYILGFTEFANLKLITREPVLIPRQETEEWVINLINNIKSKNINLNKILDIGTGTGCLALALKKSFSKAQVIASDINDLALQLAIENALKNNLEIKIIKSNLFQDIDDKNFDLIVTNPPYISNNEYESLAPSVKNFEDKFALTAPDNGLEIIKKIIKNSLNFLNKNGLLVVEIDRNQAHILKWAFQNGWKYGIYKTDFNNQPRIIILSNSAIWALQD